MLSTGVLERYADVERLLVKQDLPMVETEEARSALLVKTVREAVGMLRGVYAMIIFRRDCPHTIIGVQGGLPLMLNVCPQGCFLSTDPWGLPAFFGVGSSLAQHSICVLQPFGRQLYDFYGQEIKERRLSLPF